MQKLQLLQNVTVVHSVMRHQWCHCQCQKLSFLTELIPAISIIRVRTV